MDDKTLMQKGEGETDKKPKTISLGADATLLSVSKVITSAISLIMSMLLARIRTKGEMATYNQIIQMVDMTSSVVMLGLPKSLNYFLSRADTKEEKKKFLSFYYTFNTILSLIVGGILVLSANIISTYLFHNPAITAFLYFLALYPWTKIVTSSVENLLIVSHKTKQLIAYRILNSISLLACVGIVAYFNMTFSTYMIIFIAVEATYALVVYVFAGKIGGGIKPYCSKEMLKTVLAFSIPLGLASVVGMFNTYIDKLLIGYFMSTEQYAVYSMAAKELPVTIISSTFSAVMLPEMARMIKRKKNKEAVDLWAESTILSMIILSFVGTACIVYSRDVLMVLYGEQYATSKGAWVFALYSVYLIIRCTYYGMALNSMGKSKFIFWCSVGALASNAVLNIVLYFLFRLFGWEFVSPAVATIITTVIMDLLQLKVTSKMLDLKFSQVFPWKRAATVVLINGAFGAIFLLLKSVLPLENIFSFNLGSHKIDGSACESILLGIVWAAVYGLLMLKSAKKCWKNLKVKGE